MTDIHNLVNQLRDRENMIYGGNGSVILRPDEECIAAADTIEEQAKRIARLENRIEEYKTHEQLLSKDGVRWRTAFDVIKERDARIAELEAALKPFSEIADNYEDAVEADKICVPIGDFRHARAALKGNSND